jgi:hypothetical protein
MRRGLASIIGVVALLLALSALAFAQKAPAPKPATPPAAAQPKAKPAPPPAAEPQAPPPQLAMPDAEKIVLLLRNTLITLNDALQTGNFTVLRDRGAPGFRDANSAAQLGQAFANLAARGADLSVVSVVSPQLSEAPTLDQEKGALHLKGYFPGNPVQIDFEVLYQSVGGRWRLFVQPGSPAAPASLGGDANAAPEKK